MLKLRETLERTGFHLQCARFPFCLLRYAIFAAFSLSIAPIFPEGPVSYNGHYVNCFRIFNKSSPGPRCNSVLPPRASLAFGVRRVGREYLPPPAITWGRPSQDIGNTGGGFDTIRPAAASLQAARNRQMKSRPHVREFPHSAVVEILHIPPDACEPLILHGHAQVGQK